MLIRRLYLSIFLMGFVILSIQSCQKSEEVIELKPNAGKSFIDIVSKNYAVELDAIPLPSGVEGTWRIYVGEHGTFDDINDPKSKFYGEPGENYQLGWEASEGDRYKADVITVSFKSLEPIILMAVEDTSKNNISLHLEAEMPDNGETGQWRIVSGNGGRLIDEDNAIAGFVGQPETEYTLEWVLSYGSKEASTEFSFTTDQLKAYAGEDELDIKTNREFEEKYFTLQAFLPAGATAEWNILEGEGGTVLDKNDPSSIFQGIPDTLYTLSYTVNLDTYSSTDTLQLRFRGLWGVWTDERDEQTYRFTEINGLEWMTENYNYAGLPGEESWYYGHAYRAIVEDGHPLETEEDRKKYGRLYSYYAAHAFAPEGWRLPTVAELEQLMNSLGGDSFAKQQMVEGGKSGLDYNFPGYLEINSSGDPAFRNVFKGLDQFGYFWTADHNPSRGLAVSFFIGDESTIAGMAVLPYTFFVGSVRYVREAQP
ncbi:FISUMP domain-containing protein [Sediminitomix flava]|uniref:Uncharacterized protein (TIGR02145 family) n=1 Tax=Sediminitomix flava TaxID=379075 RepID=A0A315Z6H9_SEDFL|nr:FISUMP domain-containing protein [Sediminitomix flava]PWJ38580.1 uncharacterized protein (TIGR02145 family) [Sediminitomix flava]